MSEPTNSGAGSACKMEGKVSQNRQKVNVWSNSSEQWWRWRHQGLFPLCHIFLRAVRKRTCPPCPHFVASVQCSSSNDSHMGCALRRKGESRSSQAILDLGQAPKSNSGADYKQSTRAARRHSAITCEEGLNIPRKDHRKGDAFFLKKKLFLIGFICIQYM